MRRRTVLAATGGVLSGSAGCLRAPGRGAESESGSTANPDDTGASPGTWSQVAHDSRHTRHPPDAQGPRDAAEISWRALGDRAVYPPVVADDLYLTEAWGGGTALSLAAADGAERWSNGALPPMRWAPALHEDRLFVVTREAGNVVRLHALDTGTGDQAWVTETGITASSGQHPPAGPTLADGSVYLPSNRGVVACEAATGDVEWTATLGEHVVDTEDGPTWRTDWAKPAVTDHRVFTFDTNENYRTTRAVFAVDRATGTRTWTAELAVGDGWYLTGHAVVGADHVFVSAVKPAVSVGQESVEAGAGRLFALDVATGDVAWDWTRPRETLAPPAYADGTLYVGTAETATDTYRVHALAASDGRTRWTHRADDAVPTPTVTSDTVYLSQGSALVALATTDGTPRWRVDVGSRLGSPVVVGETAYVHTNPGHNYDSHLVAVREP